MTGKMPTRHMGTGVQRPFQDRMEDSSMHSRWQDDIEEKEVMLGKWFQGHTIDGNTCRVRQGSSRQFYLNSTNHTLLTRGNIWNRKCQARFCQTVMRGADVASEEGALRCKWRPLAASVPQRLTGAYSKFFYIKRALVNFW